MNRVVRRCRHRRRRREGLPGRRDGELDSDGVDLLKGADDEDDGDEGGEQLLREPGDEDDEVAAVEDADRDEDDAHPEADPQPERQVLQVVLAVSQIGCCSHFRML